MNFAKKVLVAGCFFTMLTAPMVSFANPAQTSPRAGVPVVSVTASKYSNVAISKVSNYVNVRSAANTSSEIVGKMYNNCAATILATVDGEGGKWYKIQSGSVTGYIKAQYFVTGSKAEKIAKEIGTTYITVNATTLRLREEASTDSRTLTLLSEEAEYIEIGEEGDFLKIEVDASLSGYVHKNYVTERVEFASAVSLEEEAAQAAEAERLRKEAEDAIAKMNQLKAEAGGQTEAPADQTSGGNAEAAAPVDQTAPGEAAAPNASVDTTAPAPAAGESANGVPVTREPIGIIVNNPNGNAGDNVATTAPVVTQPPTTQPEAAAPAETPSVSTQTGGPGTISTTGPMASAGNNAGNSAGPGSGNTAGPGASVSTAGPGSVSTNGPGGSQITQAPTSADLTSATRTAIVAYAKQYLGNPYVYGGTSLTNGADCSGFTMRIFEHFGIDTGRSSRDQAAKGKEIALSEIQPGDLIFYANGDYINHVALYIGGGQIIHASNSKTGIITSTAYYRTPYKAVTFLN